VAIIKQSSDWTSSRPKTVFFSGGKPTSHHLQNHNSRVKSALVSRWFITAGMKRSQVATETVTERETGSGSGPWIWIWQSGSWPKLLLLAHLAHLAHLAPNLHPDTRGNCLPGHAVLITELPANFLRKVQRNRGVWVRQPLPAMWVCQIPISSHLHSQENTFLINKKAFLKFHGTRKN